MKILKLSTQLSIIIILILSFSNLISADMKVKNINAKLSLVEGYTEFYFQYWEVKNDSLTFKYENNDNNLQSKTIHVNNINSFEIEKGSYAMEGFLIAYIPSVIIMKIIFSDFLTSPTSIINSFAFSVASGLVGASIGSYIYKWNEIKFIKSDGNEASMLIIPTYIHQADAVGLNLSINF